MYPTTNTKDNIQIEKLLIFQLEYCNIHQSLIKASASSQNIRIIATHGLSFN